MTLSDWLEWLGIVQAAQGKYEEATASWTKELAIGPNTPWMKQTFTYYDKAPNCEHYYKNGALYKKIKGNDFTIEVAYIWLTDVACLRVDLLITNNSAQPVDVLPANVKFVLFNPNRQELQHVCVQNLQQIMLKANTVPPGSDVAGAVCFQASQSVPAQVQQQLEIVIGKTTFIL